MELKLILQIIGVALGLLYLYLEYRVDIRLWIIGLIMPLVHGALYFNAGLYADFSMQIYYILAGLYGWIIWHNAPRHGTKAVKISHTPLRIIPLLLGGYILTHAIMWVFLSRLTDSTVPFLDAGTTAASIVAMWMLSRKYAEQWLVWLAVDIVSAGLYYYKGIPYTGALYCIYSVLAVVGYIRWRKQIRLG